MRRLFDLLTFCSCCGAYFFHRLGLKDFKLLYYLRATGSWLHDDKEHHGSN